MTNGFYTPDTFTKNTTARAEDVQAMANALEASFDKVPAQLELEQDRTTYAVTTGVADVYTVTSIHPISAYVAGHHARLKIHATNTGPSTVNFDGLGAKSIKLPDGSNPGAGDLLVGAIVDLSYDGANYRTTFVLTDVSAAAASASAASTSASNASTSETNAGNSATAAAASALQAKTRIWEFAVSNDVNALTTGDAKFTTRARNAMTITGVRASLTTVSSSGLPTVQIRIGGVDLLTTKLTIDASELTSVDAVAAAVLKTDGTEDVADDALIQIDVDIAGTGAKGLKVVLYGDETP